MVPLGISAMLSQLTNLVLLSLWQLICYKFCHSTHASLQLSGLFEKGNPKVFFGLVILDSCVFELIYVIAFGESQNKEK